MPFQIDRPKVISEVFEDEVVAVNLQTGSYYGLSTSAMEVWRFIECGAPTDDIIHALALRYQMEPIAVAADVEPFLRHLTECGLIVESSAAPDPVPDAPVTEPGAWFAPELSAYDDMKDLLLVDPIHDVDETGWPARKPVAAE